MEKIIKALTYVDTGLNIVISILIDVFLTGVSILGLLVIASTLFNGTIDLYNSDLMFYQKYPFIIMLWLFSFIITVKVIKFLIKMPYELKDSVSFEIKQLYKELERRKEHI